MLQVLCLLGPWFRGNVMSVALPLAFFNDSMIPCMLLCCIHSSACVRFWHSLPRCELDCTVQSRLGLALSSLSRMFDDRSAHTYQSSVKS